MWIFCNDCKHKRQTDNHTKTMIGYKRNIPYYIEYYHCRCGNNIAINIKEVK
jgi:hypothetical protein